MNLKMKVDKKSPVHLTVEKVKVLGFSDILWCVFG